MSKSSRWILGVFSLILSVGIVLHVLDNPSQLIGWVVLVFFLMIPLACFFPSVRPLAIRLIGGIIFGSYVAYLISSIGSENFPRALKGLLIFGVPGLHCAIFGSDPISTLIKSSNQSKNSSDSQNKNS